MGLRATEEPSRFAVDATDGVEVATVSVTRPPTGGRAWGLVQPTRGVLLRTDDVQVVALGLEELCGAQSVPVDLLVRDELLRDELRRRGWTGALRGALTAPSGGTRAPDPLDARIEQLLPGTTVARRRALLQRALTLDIGADPERPVRIRLPDRDDVMAEDVAASVDTLRAIRRRFGRHTGVRLVDFRGGSRSASGWAEGGSGVVNLNPDLVVAGELATARLRTHADSTRRYESPVLPAIALPPPLPLRVDEVTAHECWHYLEAAVLTTPERYTEFHRALGEVLGVESLELALRGADADAPDAWRAARERMVREVSAYATTSPREASAELFVQWWCHAPGRSALVDTFGAFVDRWLPAA